MSKRLFIGLEIPEETKKELIRRRDVIAGDTDFNWESSDKLHITLKFLGEVSEEKIPSIEECIKRSILEKRISEINFSNFGFFFRNNRPVILWAGFQDNHSLTKFASSLNVKLSKIGFERDERKFKPHLTLLRIKSKFYQNLVNDFKKGDLNELSFVPTEVILYESELKESGSVYTALKSFKLLTEE